MTDQVALAGTIGTWVAVFLCVLLPLVGMIPAYLLMRSSRQKNSIAIAAVHDPSKSRVSKKSRFHLSQGYRKIKVPDLAIAAALNLDPSPLLETVGTDIYFTLHGITR
jgi:hypothetical protein